MSKRKKTRQQKQIADLRQKLHHLSPTQSSEESNTQIQNSLSTQSNRLTYTPVSTPQLQKTAAFAYSNPYLKHDLAKTALLVVAVVVFEMVLLFILKQHILVLPFANF